MILYCYMIRYIMLHDVILYYTIRCYAMLCYAILYIVYYIAILYYTIPCFTVTA